MADEFSTQRRHLIYIGSGAAVVFVCALGWCLSLVWAQHARARAWVEHTHEVVVQLDKLLDDLQAAESGQRGFLVTGRDNFLVPYTKAAAAVPHDLQRLLKLAGDNDRQAARAYQLGQLAEQRLAQLAEVIRVRRAQNEDAATALVANGAGKRIMDDIRFLVAQMRDEEERLLVTGQAQADEMRLLLYASMGGLILLAGALIAVISWMAHWIKQLQAGLVTMCAWTREVKYGDDWIPVDEYLLRRFGLRVSHGMNREVARKMMAEMRSSEQSRTSGAAGTPSERRE